MKAYIITGTSGGLGNAFFELTQLEDAYVVCIARRFLPAQEAAAQQSGRTRLVNSDFNDVNSLPTAGDFAEWLCDETIDEVIFLNNAAIIEPIGAIGQLDSAQIIQAAQVNVTAAMLLTNALFAVSRVATGDLRVKVLNISSGAAKRVVEGWSVYCAVKAGNEMFFDALASEYANDERVQVHNVNPGVMDTQMQSTIRSSDFPTRQRFVNIKEEGQLPTPESVAEKIFADYVTARVQK